MIIVVSGALDAGKTTVCTIGATERHSGEDSRARGELFPQLIGTTEFPQDLTRAHSGGYILLEINSSPK